ncbi:hypothetical protein AWU67_03875 [Microterricola viridarii]|uniref:Uncharacterized protein n=2 Tax=Microterricola viridarii TaxID=412690 RepID=A0A0Y0MDN2_9MICO|nr:hypothetical protein AWU67_03875 [Microterricola viridarii]
MVLLALFAVQFLAGMVLNLFVTLPDTHPGTTGGEYFSRSWASLLWALSGAGGWTLLLHTILALALTLGTLTLFVRALALRPPPQAARRWRWGSGVAFFFTLAALFNGLSFTDYDEDFSSLIMAVCWLLALLGVVAAMLPPRHPPVIAAPRSESADAARDTP